MYALISSKTWQKTPRSKTYTYTNITQQHEMQTWCRSITRTNLWSHDNRTKTSTQTAAYACNSYKTKQTVVVLTIKHWANYRNNSQTHNNHTHEKQHAALLCNTRCWHGCGEGDKMPKIIDSRSFRIFSWSWHIVSWSLTTTTVTVIWKQLYWMYYII